ncbi:MAG: FkbM family methyltransferase [Chloroflexota bacterium]
MNKIIKSYVKDFHRSYTAGLTAAWEKRSIQSRVSSLKLNQNYPYDAEAKLLRKLDLAGKTMFDIGANSGFFSSTMEDIVTSEKLYIFEPIPKLYRYLKKRFQCAHVVNAAISDRNGKEILRLPYINNQLYDTRATLSKNHTEKNQTHFDEIEVKLIKLDDFVANNKISELSLLKVDVEGHEIEVLEGAVNTLANLKPLVFIEIEARHHKDEVSPVFDRLTMHNYKGYFLDPINRTLNTVSHFSADRDQKLEHLYSRQFHKYHNNFFFVHDSKETAFLKNVNKFLELEKTLSA